MIKNLSIIDNIENNLNLRLRIDIHLNEMTLTIQRKTESLKIENDYTDKFSITDETEVDVIFKQFYKDYLKLREVEEYWEDNFHGMKVIEFNED